MRVSSFLILLLLLLAAIPAVLPGHGFDKQVQELRDDEAAAVVNGRTYTVGELKDLVALRATATGEGFIVFTIVDLLRAGHLAPAYTKLADEARAEGITLTEADHQWTQDVLRHAVERQLYATHVLDRRTTPTTEALRTSYEAQKDERFHVPERMVLRELFFPAKDGDSGKAAADAAWERLEAGEDIGVLQREAIASRAFHFSTNMVELDAVKRGNPAMYEMLRGLGEQGFSRPIELANGHLIVQRQLYLERTPMPFESVSTLLHEEALADQDLQAMLAFYRDLAEKSGLLRLHSQNLVNAGALAFDSDLLLSIGDQDFTRGDLRRIVGWKLAPDRPQTDRMFLDMVLMTGPVQEALLDYVIERDQLMASGALARLRVMAEETVLVRHLLDERFAATKPEVTEQEILAHAATQGIEATPESRAEIREQLVANRRIEFEIEELDRLIESVTMQPLIKVYSGDATPQIESN